ncbi:MAG: CorA family divalent cation transporter [Pigmentiphaga sp.]
MGSHETDHQALPTDGVILAWAVGEHGEGHAVAAADLRRHLAGAEEMLWLHVNLGDRRVIHWLESWPFLPQEIRSSLRDRSTVARQDVVSLYEEGMLFKLSDFQLEVDEQDDESLRFGTFWCYLTERVLITGGVVPLRTFDALHKSLQRRQFVPRSPAQIFQELIDVRSLFIDQAIERLSAEIDALEELIISDQDLPGDKSIGRIRILCNRIRRTFNQEKVELYHMLRKAPEGVIAAHRDVIEEHYEDLTHSLDLVDSLSNRARVVQDEQTAHVADRNARNLNMLSVVTVFFLPMTLIAGIMGMNMADLPGLTKSFYPVMGLMFGLCLLVYILLRIRKLI